MIKVAYGTEIISTATQSANIFALLQARNYLQSAHSALKILHLTLLTP